MESIVRRVTARYKTSKLEMGRTFFNENLKIHRYAESVVVTDLTNAGKRGKTCMEMHIGVDSFNRDEINGAIDSIIDDLTKAKTYEDAKKVVQAELVTGNFQINERALRGVDVEPMGTVINTDKKFPDGSTVRIKASPQSFRVVHSYPLIHPGTGKDTGNRQDTMYYNYKKQDGAAFYAWIKTNLAKAGKMTIQELRDQWDALGIKYDHQ